MQFGLISSAQPTSTDLPAEAGGAFRDYVALNVTAEQLGFQSSFLVEHHFTGWNQASATLLLLTCLAMRTSSLRLGSAVIVLPWHNPVLLAEEAATLDLVSGGRLDFGIGKGYRHNEFNGFQIPPEQADARFEEAIEVITRAWLTRARFSHRGRFWCFENIVVEPPPAQRPHPPVWVAAATTASIRRAAKRGFNLILDQYASAQQIGERIALYRAERAAHGQPFNPLQVAVARQLYVADNAEDAEAALARLAKYTQRTVAVSSAPGAKGGSHVLAYADKAEATEEHALYGTPDQLCAKLSTLNNAGAEYVLLQVAGGEEQLQRFAREIIPAFPAALQTRAASPTG
ncbi:MAG TPA: LLM class flavin-dependent oxidoreductase [Solirubrobacteraceae bacterium]|nr:LLM class flavin-dependent oxidoreductase [Solirubrobacteraceae bacterium]